MIKQTQGKHIWHSLSFLTAGLQIVNAINPVSKGIIKQVSGLR